MFWYPNVLVSIYPSHCHLGLNCDRDGKGVHLLMSVVFCVSELEYSYKVLATFQFHSLLIFLPLVTD